MLTPRCIFSNMTNSPAVTRAKLHEDIGSGRARQLRKQAGLSQSDIACSIGASRSTVASWEAGRRRPLGELADRYAGLLESLKDVLDNHAGSRA